LEIQEGVFDASPEEISQSYDSSLPNHTQDLRVICSRVVEAGEVSEGQKQKIRELLLAENPALTPENLDDLEKIVLGSAL
jgi:hypothetical protein